MRSPRRRLTIIGSLLLLAMIAVGLGVYFLKREPIYEGRPISAWIDELTGGVGNSAGATTGKGLPRLLDLEVGPEIVPYLCSALRRGDTRFDRIYVKHFPKIPSPIAKIFPAPNPTRDAEIRYRAGLILYYMGSKASKAARSLRYRLRDSNPEVRRVAASAFAAVANSEQPPPSELLDALGDPEPSVRQAVLKSLAALKADPGIIVPRFAALLRDADEGVRVAAAQVLKDLGPDAKRAVPDLVMALDDPNADVFRFSAMALGRMGPAAKAAVPSLQGLLKQPRPFSETTVRWALRQIDPSSLESSKQ